MVNKKIRKGKNDKQRTAFVGPNRVMGQVGPHNYTLEAHRQQSVQHDSRFKLYKHSKARLVKPR